MLDKNLEPLIELDVDNTPTDSPQQSAGDVLDEIPEPG